MRSAVVSWSIVVTRCGLCAVFVGKLSHLLHRFRMLELEDALAQILATISSPATEHIPLSDASGRVLAEPIESPVDLPVFDNSAMDGYGVRAGDIASANRGSPKPLRLVGKAAAGEAFAGEVTAGTCVRLFTGSPLPRGADAVVRQEDTRVASGASGSVLFLAPADPGENVRRRGEDVKRGTPLVRAGEVLTVGRISLLAAVGLTNLCVAQQPVVGLVPTGSELKEPGQPLAPGQIYESNRSALAVLARRAGAIPKAFPVVADTLATTRSVLAAAFEQCDAVVTSGGVSVGEMDFVRRAFQEIGGEMRFWKVAIRPGRPFAFGRCGRKFLFGLPGNPVSALVTFLLLVRPALLRWQGAIDLSLPTRAGMLAEPLANPEDRRHFIRVKLDESGKVHSAGLQGSHVLSSMAVANGLVDLPPRATLVAGTLVQMISWE